MARKEAPRDRRPETSSKFSAFLKRAQSKKGGAGGPAARAVVEGPTPGVNKWRRIAQRVEGEEEEEEEEEEDELESEDGYPLRPESEDELLQLENEQEGPLQLDGEDGGFDEIEESEEEPPVTQKGKRQREEAPPRKPPTQRRPEPEPRQEKQKTAGKVPAGRAKVRDVGRLPSERSSTSSRPASQRLPPPPISSPFQDEDFAPALSPPPAPPPPRRRKQTSAPSLKAIRLAEKQAEIERLIDAHDTVLREMFHLESFKTMVVGFDPGEAKKETSKVWKGVSSFGFWHGRC